MKNIHLPGDSKGRGLAAPARALLFLLLVLALALPQGALASSTLPPPKVATSVTGNTLSVTVAPRDGADPTFDIYYTISVFRGSLYEDRGGYGTYIFPNLAPGEGTLSVLYEVIGSPDFSETYQSTFIIKQDNTIILSGYPAVAYAGLTAAVTVGSTYPVTNPQTTLTSSDSSLVSVAPGGSPNTYNLTFLKEGSFTLGATLSGDDFYNPAAYSQVKTVGPAFDINPPANFSAALNQDTGAVSLSWDPPAGNAAGYLIGYDYIRKAGGTTYLPSSLTDEARGASYSPVLPEDGPVAFSARAIYHLPSQTGYSYSAYSAEVTVLRKADSYITALGLPAGASQPMGISLPVLVSHTGGDLQVANNAPLVCSITQSPMMGNSVQIIVTPKAPGTVSLTFSLPETETAKGYSLTYTHPVIAVPGPVLNGKVNGQGGTLSVSFDPPAPAAGFTLAGYTLRVEAASGEAVFEQAGAASPLSVSGLKPGETYNIFLNANFTEYGYQTTASLGSYQYKNPNAITFADPGFMEAGTSKALAPVSSSGLAVSLESLNPDIIAVSGPVNGQYTLNALAAGTARLTATQPGDATTQAADPVSLDVRVVPARFENHMFVDDDFDGYLLLGRQGSVTAGSIAGVPSFTILTPDTASMISEQTDPATGFTTLRLNPLKTGTLRLLVESPGNEQYRPISREVSYRVVSAFPEAPRVTSFTKEAGSLTVSFAPAAPVSGFTLDRYMLVAGNEELGTFDAYGPASPLTLSGLKPGFSYNVSFMAFYNGNDYWNGTDLGSYLYKHPNAITLLAPGPQMVGGSLVVTPFASSGLAVSLRSNKPAVCAVEDLGEGRFELSFLTAGTASLTTTQEGDFETQAAQPLTISFEVADKTQPAAPPERTPHPAVSYMDEKEPGLYFLLAEGKPESPLPYRLAGYVSLKEGNALRLSLNPYAFSGLGETVELRLPASLITALGRRGMAYVDTAFMGLRLRLGLDDLNALLKEGREGSLVVSLTEVNPDTLGEEARAALAPTGPVAFAFEAAFLWQSPDGAREALPVAALPHCGFELMSGQPLLHGLPLQGEAQFSQPFILGLGDGLYAVKAE